MPGDRMRRVNEAVKEVLSTHIAGDLRDPRIGFVLSPPYFPLRVG